LKVYNLTTASGTYDITRYPWAYSFWEQQQKTHWLPSEVAIGGDVKDWATKITDNERALLTQIFRFFTQSDVEVGGNYIERLLPVFKPLEIQMMMAAFTNMETVHIDAYALILKTLGMPQTEFEAFRDYKEMADKTAYMHGFKMDTEADVAKTLAMFGAFTEGMSLFASFAMLLNFPRHNKMNGMGQIVTWSVRDESLHCEAMIKLYHEWNKETGAVTPAVKRSIRTIARTMLDLEENFIDLAFSLGPVEGMTPEDVKSYVSLVTDWRLVQLKLKPICGYFDKQGKQLKPHPLPWLVEILNGVEYANFFEVRATDYSKAASTGTWEQVWENINEKNY
jgi:ribonucleoside-diphosphate reductase beta chain